MTEKLLQYIWLFRQYNTASLTTTSGEIIRVIHPGIPNHNQGPDFIAAKISIGTTLWVGSVELHTRASAWKQHQHGKDPNYRNVILHVVWEEDQVLELPFPVLVLHDRVPKWLLHRYHAWMESNRFIPCENNISSVPALLMQFWKERLVAERMELRLAQVSGYLAANKHHWEETFWWMIARGFGGKVNAGAFEKMARSLPFTILSRHKNQLQQVEALLLGQAGLLAGTFKDQYPQQLKTEYTFQQAKYQLKPGEEPVFMLRMRPAGFPALRLAQLAGLVHSSIHLFSQIRESQSLSDAKALLNVKASAYWDRHYRFDEASVYLPKALGPQMIDHLLINAIIPVLFTWGHYHGQQALKDKAIAWLGGIMAESNSLVRQFAACGVSCRSAFDSQALIQLHNTYCRERRCVQCAIGVKLLKSNEKENI